jgi:hypothetical protein
MKNLVKTTIVILCGFFLVGFLIGAGDSNRSTTAQSYDENYDYAENYEDEYNELQSCLEEWKEAHSEYQAIIDEAHSNLDGWGEGDEYEDLITAMDEAKYTLDSAGDNTPYCD